MIFTPLSAPVYHWKFSDFYFINFRIDAKSSIVYSIALIIAWFTAFVNILMFKKWARCPFFINV